MVSGTADVCSKPTQILPYRSRGLAVRSWVCVNSILFSAEKDVVGFCTPILRLGMDQVVWVSVIGCEGP